MTIPTVQFETLALSFALSKPLNTRYAIVQHNDETAGRALLHGAAQTCGETHGSHQAHNLTLTERLCAIEDV